MSGQVATFGQGTLTPDDGHGIAAEFSQGSVGLSVTLALVGAALALSQGVANPNTDGVVPLTGSSVTTTTGTLVLGVPQALTGSSITSAGGTLTLTLRPTDISSSPITSAAGTVVAQGAGGSAHLSGQEITSDLGDVGSGYQFVTGSESVGAQTTPAVSSTTALTGSAITCTVGSLSPNQDAVDSLIESAIGNATPAASVVLSGEGLAINHGFLLTSGDASFALTGVESTGTTGTIGIEESYPVTSQVITASQYNVGAPGGASLSGAEVSAVAGNVFTDNDRSFAISGISIAVQDGITFASSLAFPAGQTLAASQGAIGPRTVALSGSSITATVGIIGAYAQSDSNPGGWPIPPRKKKKKEEERERAVIAAQEEDRRIVALQQEKREIEEKEAILKKESMEREAAEATLRQQIIEEEINKRLQEIEEETLLLLVVTK